MCQDAPAGRHKGGPTRAWRSPAPLRGRCDFSRGPSGQRAPGIERDRAGRHGEICVVEGCDGQRAKHGSGQRTGHGLKRIGHAITFGGMKVRKGPDRSAILPAKRVRPWSERTPRLPEQPEDAAWLRRQIRAEYSNCTGVLVRSRPGYSGGHHEIGWPRAVQRTCKVACNRERFRRVLFGSLVCLMI